MLAQYPYGLSSLLSVLQEVLQPLPILVLCGAEPGLQAWRAALRDVYSAELFSVALQENYPGLPEPLQKPVSQKPVAWLCSGTHCLPALHDLADLRAALKSATNL